MRTPSKYKPHQGSRECERRIRQSQARRGRLLDEMAKADAELLDT